MQSNLAKIQYSKFPKKILSYDWRKPFSPENVEISNKIRKGLQKAFPKRKEPVPLALRFDYPESIAKTFNGAKATKPKPKRKVAGAVLPTLPPQKSKVEGSELHIKILDYVRKRDQEIPDAPTLIAKYRCSPGFAVGHSNSNKFFKVIVCGKEWCKECGKYLSDTHIRRIVRLQPKIDQIGSNMSYLVVTVPTELRKHFLNKELLNQFREYWRRKIKREYPGTKGYIRYHWAGDIDPTLWHPHLNIIWESKGFIKPDVLQLWRNELSQWFANTLKLSYYPKPNLYHAYAQDKTKEDLMKRKHWLNYVTRATYHGNNQDVKKTVKGFRNTAPFGKFEKSSEELKDELSAAMRKNIDVTDGSKIIWEKRTKKVERETVDEETGEVIKTIEDQEVLHIHPFELFKSKVIDSGATDMRAGFFKLPNLEKPPD